MTSTPTTPMMEEGASAASDLREHSGSSATAEIRIDACRDASKPLAPAEAASEEKAAEVYGRFEVLQPEDVSAALMHALGAPPRVQIHDVLMRPTQQPG